MSFDLTLVGDFNSFFNFCVCVWVPFDYICIYLRYIFAYYRGESFFTKSKKFMYRENILKPSLFIQNTRLFHVEISHDFTSVTSLCLINKARWLKAKGNV